MASNRRVLMVCRQHPKHHHGGLATAAWATAKAARDADWHVVFATAQHPKKGAKKQRSQEDGITVAWLPGCGHRPGAYPQFHSALGNSFSALQNEFGFSLIHTHSSGAAPLIDRGLPVVFQDHGLRLSMAQNEINRNWLLCVNRVPEDHVRRVEEMYFKNAPRLPNPEGTFLRRCSRVLVLNTETLWEVRARYFLLNAEVFHYPLYAELQGAGPVHKPPLVTMCASNLNNPEKGIMHGLTLLKPIANEITIKLIGPGDTAVELANRLFPRVRATGWLDQAALVREFTDSDLLFECSNHHHGLNSTAVFALATGLPVVGFPIPGLWDVVGNNEAGRIVSPFDSARVCSDVLLVAAHKADYSDRARQRFRELFSPEYASRTLDRIYQGVV